MNKGVEIGLVLMVAVALFGYGVANERVGDENHSKQRVPVVVSGLAASDLGKSSMEGLNSNGISVEVIRVVDGDTVVVMFENGREETVRLIGINTPETVDFRKPV